MRYDFLEQLPTNELSELDRTVRVAQDNPEFSRETLTIFSGKIREEWERRSRMYYDSQIKKPLQKEDYEKIAEEIKLAKKTINSDSKIVQLVPKRGTEKQREHIKYCCDQLIKEEPKKFVIVFLSQEESLGIGHMCDTLTDQLGLLEWAKHKILNK